MVVSLQATAASTCEQKKCCDFFLNATERSVKATLPVPLKKKHPLTHVLLWIVSKAAAACPPIALLITYFLPSVLLSAHLAVCLSS